MTRKDELAEKLRRGIAKQIRNIRAIYPTTLYDEPAQRLEGRLVEELCAVAQQVEREVLSRLDAYMDDAGGMNNIRDWIMAQQKELG